MLDRLPPEVRHLLLMLAASLLGWTGSDLVPVLQGRGGAAALLAPVVMTLVAILTPVTRQYGVGSDRSVTEPPPGRHEAREPPPAAGIVRPPANLGDSQAQERRS